MLGFSFIIIGNLIYNKIIKFGSKKKESELEYTEDEIEDKLLNDTNL